MKVLVNGRRWLEVKKVNNFNELLLYFYNKIKGKNANIFWRQNSGILIEGILNNGKSIELFIETTEQYKNRLNTKQLKEIF